MRNMIQKGKRSKTLSEVKLFEKLDSEEFSRDKSCAKGSPAFI